MKSKVQAETPSLPTCVSLAPSTECAEGAAYKCLLNRLWGETVVGGKSKLVSKHRYIIQCNIQLAEQKNIAIRMLMRGKRNKKTINPLRGESMFACIPIARPHASHIFVIK